MLTLSLVYWPYPAIRNKLPTPGILLSEIKVPNRTFRIFSVEIVQLTPGWIGECCLGDKILIPQTK
jgi:hypothetical protein